MADQVGGMIRDSDVKFECRLLLHIIQIIKLPKELEDELLEPISRIVDLENKRLDDLRDKTTTE